jgi:hypothetical protein
MKVTGNGQQNQIREKASFCLKIFCRCKKAGNLILSKDPKVTISIRTRIRNFFADGHTDKQMIPHIQYNGKTIVLWLIY